MTQLDYLKALIANDALIQDANDNMFKRYGISQGIPQEKNREIDSFQYKIGVMQSLKRIALNPDEVYNLLYTLGQIEDYASHATEFQKHMLNRRNVSTDKFMSEWERYRETVILHGILPIQNVPQQYIDVYNKKLEDRKDLAKELSNRRKDHTELLSELEDIHKQIQFEMDAYNKDLKREHMQWIELLNEQEYLLRQDIDNEQSLLEWDYYLLKQQEQAEKDDILRNESMNRLIPNLGNIGNISTTNLPQYDSTYNKFINAMNQSRLEDTEKQLMANEDARATEEDYNKSDFDKFVNAKNMEILRNKREFEKLMKNRADKSAIKYNLREAEKRMMANEDREVNRPFIPENVVEASSDPWAVLESQWADMKREEDKKKKTKPQKEAELEAKERIIMVLEDDWIRNRENNILSLRIADSIEESYRQANETFIPQTKNWLKNTRTRTINVPHYAGVVPIYERDIKNLTKKINEMNNYYDTHNFTADEIDVFLNDLNTEMNKLNNLKEKYSSIMKKSQKIKKLNKEGSST